jgi:transcriptional regulatory protein LEU3
VLKPSRAEPSHSTRHRFFEHFHPYMPVIRTRDPDTCYRRGPVLFWAIIFTACRRYARDDTVLQFLVDSLIPQIWSSVSQPPLRLSVINALILLATWPSPYIRFLSDPSLIFAGIAMNSSFLLGLHTGRGDHMEFHARDYQQDTSDEEASYTWSGCNIIANK